MTDYYEVGRLKVCERHKEEALRIVGSKSGNRTTRAEKRKTRLVDA